MENASKALIIAGAILLAIVIISLGLIVVNNSRNSVDNANLSEQEIQTFNAKFIAYEGSSVSGSRVNSLIQQVIATNQDLLEQGKATASKSKTFIHIVYPSISNEKEATNKYIYIGGLWNEGKNIASQNVSSTAFISGDNLNQASGYNNLSRATSVSTGKNYTVKIEKYENGLVHFITITPNS